MLGRATAIGRCKSDSAAHLFYSINFRKICRHRKPRGKRKDLFYAQKRGIHAWILHKADAKHPQNSMSASVTEILRLFYVENRQPLYTYALSITRNRESAEDAIHQAFLNLLKRPALPNDLRPYIFRCVRNSAVDALRRTKVQQHSIFEDYNPLENKSSPTVPRLSSTELRVWLDHLSPEEQETIILKVYDALTFQEIADLRETPLHTVASWYRRGIEKLRSLLAHDAP